MGDKLSFGRFFRRRIRDLVLGANDGIITTFAVVAGVTGAELPATVIVVLGVANLFADGISMGASSYLGRKSEKDRDDSPGKRAPMECALSTFGAFIVGGLIPLLAYLLSIPLEWRFPLAVILTASALFTFGAARCAATHRSWSFSGVEMLAVGSLAAATAYVVGWMLRSVVTDSAV